MVASAISADAILFTGGHGRRDLLTETGAKTTDNLVETAKWIVT